MDLDPVPLISIVIPVYNGEKTVVETLTSIANQDCSQLEILVIDDGSKDDSFSVIRDFLENSRLKNSSTLIRHVQNQGLSMTLNNGIQKANGSFVLILHQDCKLVGVDWIRKAASFMDDARVAIVTGYYGLPDVETDTFVKRAFGVLRKQFHSRSKESYEYVTFSEGKCDLFRKETLVRAGCFPTEYRIAGEDLVVSYKLRAQGYHIIKCYELPVIQKFTGSAESFGGNVGKEFLFGKVAGGVFSQFKFYLFRDLKESNYSSSRSLHRASQPFFVLALCLGLISGFWFPWFILFSIALLVLRYVYYLNRVASELRTYGGVSKSHFWESWVVGIIGILTDFAYGIGFIYGLALHTRVGRT